MSDVKLLVGTGDNNTFSRPVLDNELGFGLHSVGAADPSTIPVTPAWLDDTNNPAMHTHTEAGSQMTKSRQTASAIYAIERKGSTTATGTTGKRITMYKSTDGGGSWTEQDAANAPYFARTANANYEEFPCTLFKSGALLYVIGISDPLDDGSGSFQLKDVPFDTSTDTWGSQELWGFLPGQDSDAYRVGCVAGIRPDASLIVAYTDVKDSTWFQGQVTIKKRVSGVWSTIATLGSSPSVPDWVELAGGCLDKDGNLQLILSSSTNPSPFEGAQFDLKHVSVSAATDAVSAYHLIESTIEGDSVAHGFVNAGGYGCCWYAQPCNKVGHCYGYRTENNFTWYGTYGETHFALLDLTSDPLNPTITQSVVSSSNAGYEPEQNQDFATAFHDGKWWAYWCSRYPTSPASWDGTQEQLFRSGSADGATGWSAPAVVASSSQSDRGIVDVCLAPPSSFAPAGGILPFMADDIPMGTTGTSGGGDCGGGGSGGGPAMY